jgi:transposase
MQSYYVGLDVHSRESVFVVENEAGAIVARGSVPTTVSGMKHLRDSCSLPAATGVALETGTVAFFVARELARLELKPVVIDAHEVRRKAQRPEQKSDTRDALELCEGLRRGFYRSLVHVPSPAISDLRTTLSRRRHFIRIQTAEVNAVKRLLRGFGRNSGRRGSLRTDAHWQSLLASDLLPEQLREHVHHHYAVWRQAAELGRALDHSLGDTARERRDAVKRLETVPGVGPIVALTTIAVLAEVSRFESAKHAASYAGLVPSTFQSGERDAHGHITKRGSAELRAMLCEAAHHARLPVHPLHPYFARVCARRGYKTAVVAVAHRLCRILFAMLRDGTEFSVTRVGVEEGDFKRTTAYKYRLRPKPAGRLPMAG